MKLSPRLQTIADFVEQGKTIADIGTDHGYIPVHLVKNGISPKGIAADVNEGPLQSAKDYIEQNQLNDKIETRLGDGLQVLGPKEVDTVIIAGMGGLLIRDILEDDRRITDSIRRFILQPMVATEDLRKYLYENGFSIENEKLAREKDRFYEIITVVKGEEKVEDEIYYEIGKKLVENKDELLVPFINKKLKATQKILKNLENRKSEQSIEKYRKLKGKYDNMMEVIDKL